MPKVRLGDLLNIIQDEKQEIRVKGFYTKISYGMEEVSDRYLRRYVLDIKTSMDNYNSVLELYFEDELH